jgi:hypothetical protein
MCSTLSVGDQVSHSYKTTDKILWYSVMSHDKSLQPQFVAWRFFILFLHAEILSRIINLKAMILLPPEAGSTDSLCARTQNRLARFTSTVVRERGERGKEREKRKEVTFQRVINGTLQGISAPIEMHLCCPSRTVSTEFC